MGDIVARHGIRNTRSIRLLAKKMAESVMQPTAFFQQDPYVITSTPCPGGWTDSLTTYVEQILLSADGKIIMECWGNLFRFFTRLIKERLSKYKLADSLLVAISG